jgi:hypothetical protein
LHAFAHGGERAAELAELVAAGVRGDAVGGGRGLESPYGVAQGDKPAQEAS